jgi:uncharacterized protein (UPF0276 family)
MPERAFDRRASRIPPHGLGLSVDVYQPDVFELAEALARHGLPYGYLEIFKAAEPALAEVRRFLPSMPLAYHGEGLWMTQSDWTTAYPFEQELDLAVAHLRALGSHWMTHECAAKQMAGFSFGTYLPPLFTRASAEVTAEHVSLVQDRLDRSVGGTAGPLLLLEMPPLTYFAFGEMPIPDFFRRITELAPCGLVLDIGHLWTVYRYVGAWRRCSLHAFLSEFLDVFPMERVVQIHLAGLAVHDTGIRAGEPQATTMQDNPPFWIDAHGAPIPEVLWDMLHQVLSHSGLRNLKGIALEVDTKAIPQIVAEFRRFRERFGQAFTASLSDGERQDRPDTPAGLTSERRERSVLARQYRLYVQSVSAVNRIEWPSLALEPEGLAIYRGAYLPHEILHWGGELAEMFPLSCSRLAEAGLSLDAFVAYWFREPRPVDGPYDFFLLKVERFKDFVREVLPSDAAVAEREAAELKVAYLAACDAAAPLTVHA